MQIDDNKMSIKGRDSEKHQKIANLDSILDNIRKLTIEKRMIKYKLEVEEEKLYTEKNKIRNWINSFDIAEYDKHLYRIEMGVDESENYYKQNNFNKFNGKLKGKEKNEEKGPGHLVDNNYERNEDSDSDDDRFENVAAENVVETILEQDSNEFIEILDDPSNELMNKSSNVVDLKIKNCNDTNCVGYDKLVSNVVETKEKTKLKCNECGKVFRNKFYLEKHKRSRVTIRFMCEICKKNFSTKHCLKMHIKRIHRFASKIKLHKILPKPSNCRI